MRTISSSRSNATATGGAAPASVDPAAPPRSVVAADLVTHILSEFQGFKGEFRCAVTERLVKAGVSMTNLHVLGLLSSHGEMPMSKLADVLDVSFSNATGLIDRMEERGLLERVRVADDRRIVLVRLTAKGEATLEEVEILRYDLLERLLARLDEPQLARLAACLADIHVAAVDLVADPDAAAHTDAHTHGSRHSHETTYPLAGEHRRTSAHRSPVAVAKTGADGSAH